MKTKKGLQKFTKSQLKIERVYNLKKITSEVLNTLTKTELKKLHDKVSKELQEFKG